MIVACPNCSLEQSLDPFCAGCGKQLPKLIQEKNEKLAAKKKKTHALISGSVFFFILSAYFYYAYQHPESLNFSKNKSGTTAIILPKTRIKGESFKAGTEAMSFKAATVASSKKLINNIKVQKTEKTEAVKAPPLGPKIKSLSFVTAKNCANGEIDAGGLLEEDLNIFLECSVEVFKINISDGVTEVDESFVFQNKINHKVSQEGLSINFKIQIEDSPFSKSSNLALAQSPKEKAGEIWNNPVEGFEINSADFKSEEINKELLASYALSTLLGLAKEGDSAQKGYFLAVYK